ncbi:hypothetical protein AJ85_07855 [Alkalihalobacillus alcalophilus ATCC 27647 = CGMCC 1.3604]|uniref:PRC-barrel domain-containing protein n=1 Tax=Alkalihalobacillus alcalophilus ATCC 27647 = CGMCC 1.3604 TaxID=1218173 RepID=A0A094XF74_ALKAL|nr:PRC-barrel domain-containing protein [Alkalihalobacillus alcalophilus]KGA97420.1 hypothetical protein BALCAV_0210495 [Alkalihalobacillus alcalophilus ATCC 27647 = CGMCC 1.3604]MED1561569.1 PRC-barrel domain-containing protein [Alkalihalobacillus alcalophilus]THG90973.1 hypothetical protein AJ85_07855 [Alkalihalobacillus alcalophilus ATCC 27647 = CGMCC 1.3604]
MLIEAGKLKKYSMKALDDELGSIDDFIFESDTFKIRYVVADTRKWFIGGQVLLRMAAFEELDFIEKTLTVNLTKEQIKNSPKPEDHEPFSRSFEKRLNDHYGWDHYWLHAPGAIPTGTGPSFVGRTAYTPATPPMRELDKTSIGADENETTSTTEEPTLQSFDHLNKFHIHAKNGQVGQLVDCIMNYDTSEIRYFIVNVGGFLSKDLVVVSVDMLKEISHLDRTITVSIEKELIENGPNYNADQPFTREHEEQIYRHYDITPYWEMSSSTK